MTLALEKSFCFYMISFYSDLSSDTVSVLPVFTSELSSPLLSMNTSFEVFFLTQSYLFVFQVGYESPHPHMRVPGLPASLQSAASGKP